MEVRATEAPRLLARFSKSLGETPVASEPGESALDHPAARQDDEALHVAAALDDLRAQRRHLWHRNINLPGSIAAIGPDQFEPREAPAYLVEDEPGPVAVLDRGRVNADAHRQPFTVATPWSSDATGFWVRLLAHGQR